MTYVDDRPAGFPPPPPFHTEVAEQHEPARTAQPSLRRRIVTVTGAVTTFAAVSALGAYSFDAAGEASGLRDELTVQEGLRDEAEAARDATASELADAEVTVGRSHR
jgi:hypothetical protein